MVNDKALQAVDILLFNAPAHRVAPYPPTRRLSEKIKGIGLQCEK